jgi:hypothetical protein
VREQAVRVSLPLPSCHQGSGCTPTKLCLFSVSTKETGVLHLCTGRWTVTSMGVPLGAASLIGVCDLRGHLGFCFMGVAVGRIL